jgi:hypothetical protein
VMQGYLAFGSETAEVLASSLPAAPRAVVSVLVCTPSMLDIYP